MSDKRFALTTEEALSRLQVIPDYDDGGEGGPKPCVHAVRDGGFMRIGAHWPLTAVRAVFDQYGAEEAGPRATADGYGVLVIDESGPLFLATRETQP